MNDLAADRHSAFLDTSSKPTLDRWDEVLKLQVDLFSPSEVAFLSRFQPWLTAKSVLDVGCGNGDFVALLSAGFPAKRYAAIDLSSGLIAQAVSSHRGDNLAFSVGDYFTFTLESEQRFDLILMRFIVQHLPDFQAILARADELLSPRGKLLIIEPDLSSSRNIPATPAFETLIRTFEQARNDGGLMRKRLQDPIALLADTRGWRLATNEVVQMRFAEPIELKRVHLLYRRWTEMFEDAGLFPFQFAAVNRELDEWTAAPRAHSEIGLRAICLERTLDGSDEDQDDDQAGRPFDILKEF